ncbi:hypothetical protein NC652_003470 [Populus alba x Populus x berolinensis]|nr:hypothetical protein NC652_003470 [Populus alba x Populus x berolinensis]
MEGVTCRFHHPVPVAAEVSKPFNSTCSGAYMRGHSLGNHNLESFTARSKRPSVSSDKISLKTVSCLSNHSSQAPRMHPLPEQTPLKSKWSCQLPKKSSVPNAPPFSSDRISRKTVPRLGNHSSHALGAYSHQEQILHQPVTLMLDPTSRDVIIMILATVHLFLSRSLSDKIWSLRF